MGCLVGRAGGPFSSRDSRWQKSFLGLLATAPGNAIETQQLVDLEFKVSLAGPRSQGGALRVCPIAAGAGRILV